MPTQAHPIGVFNEWGKLGTGAITFGSGAVPVLTFATADAPNNTIAGIDNGDTIHVTDLVTKSPSAKAGAGGVLTIPYVSNGGGTLQLNLDASDAGKLFLFESDGASLRAALRCHRHRHQHRLAVGRRFPLAATRGRGSLHKPTPACPVPSAYAPRWQAR